MRLGILITTLCLVTSALATTQPSFDPRDVVRRVHEARGGPAAGERGFADDGEFLLDTNVVLVPTRGDQMEAAVAFDGTNFLVVWEDASHGGIYGSRVDQSGAVLDPVGIAISGAASGQYVPAVSFDGTSFLVVWQDYRSGNDDIYGARVNLAGIVLDPDGIPISTATDRQESPAVAIDGTSFLVVWADHRGGEYETDIYGARVSQEGTVLDPNGIAISTAAYAQSYPAAVSDGTNFLVVWGDGRGGNSDIYGARVTPGGTVLDPDGIVISQAANNQGDPALGFDGANFLVVWEDNRGGDSDIYGARVNQSGAVLDPVGIAISGAASGQDVPSVAFDDTDFLVVWTDQRNGQYENDIYGARVSPAGTVLDPDGVVISTAARNQYFPVVAFGGTNFLVVWHDVRNGSYDIYGARLSQTGAVLDPDGIIVSTAANEQYTPALAFDGTNFLAVWQDYHDSTGTSDIYGARVSQTGVVLDPTGFVISSADGNEQEPAVCSDGASFFVVWEDQRDSYTGDIYGARVTPDGTVPDPEGIPISTAHDGQEYPAVTFDGADFLVVWDDMRYEQPSPDIFGARVTREGMVLDTAGLVISVAEGAQLVPAVGFDGTNSLVAWSEDGDPGSLYAARVSPSGVVLDSVGIRVADSAYFPSVAKGTTTTLVVWESYRNFPSDTDDIYGARVSPSGVVLDTAEIAISTAPGRQGSPVAAFDGTDFLVAWDDVDGIHGARLSQAGVVFDSGPIRQAAWDPALACGVAGRMLLAYEGWAGRVGDRVYNAHRAWGKMDPNPGIEESRQPPVYSLRPAATVIHDVLFLPKASSHKPQTSSLLDIAGRKVLDLQAGANDVHSLAPGVYFVRAVSRQPLAVSCTKVVLTR